MKKRILLIVSILLLQSNFVFASFEYFDDELYQDIPEIRSVESISLDVASPKSWKLAWKYQKSKRLLEAIKRELISRYKNGQISEIVLADGTQELSWFAYYQSRYFSYSLLFENTRSPDFLDLANESLRLSRASLDRFGEYVRNPVK